MPEYRTYKCEICDFTYREESGLLEHEIAAGTLWDSLSSDWTCPDCDADKDNFEVVPQ